MAEWLPSPPAGPRLKIWAEMGQLINIWLTCIAYTITAATCLKARPLPLLVPPLAGGSPTNVCCCGARRGREAGQSFCGPCVGLICPRLPCPSCPQTIATISCGLPVGVK